MKLIKLVFAVRRRRSEVSTSWSPSSECTGNSSKDVIELLIAYPREHGVVPEMQLARNKPLNHLQIDRGVLFAHLLDDGMSVFRKIVMQGEDEFLAQFVPAAERTPGRIAALPGVPRRRGCAGACHIVAFVAGAAVHQVLIALWPIV